MTAEQSRCTEERLTGGFGAENREEVLYLYVELLCLSLTNLFLKLVDVTLLRLRISSKATAKAWVPMKWETKAKTAATHALNNCQTILGHAGDVMLVLC